MPNANSSSHLPICPAFSSQTLVSTPESPISPALLSHFLSRAAPKRTALERVNLVKFSAPHLQPAIETSPPKSVVTDHGLWQSTSYLCEEEEEEEEEAAEGQAEEVHPAHRSGRQLQSRSPEQPRTVEMSDSNTAHSPIFDHVLELGDDDVDVEQYTNPTQPTSGVLSATADDGMGSYDLKPPPPSTPLSNIELLSERLFSLDHLRIIIRDPALHARFNSFLQKYRPNSTHSLRRYLDTQKALSAIDYANSLAEQLVPGSLAAILEEDFEARSQSALGDLVNDVLPGYVTHRLVQVVTETLVKEITGQNMPIMRELVPSLAEVYCLTDPSLPDNPIVYASDEFYRTSQYGRDYVIGRNCRFLQGPRSSGASVTRLIEALADGQEICETLLNYRRDGSPFMNLLLIAPLYDNRGTVRYFIGAQIDVNGLIEGGRGLESFERLLAQDRREARYGDNMPIKTPTAALAELSCVLSESDMDVVKNSALEKRNAGSGTSTPVQEKPTKSTAQRRYIGMDNPDDKKLWPAPNLGPSGRLPGVFQNYLLVRPFPSLRITFTSPALRIPGLLQARLLDRIGGPVHIREGIQSAMSSGIGVTAKITWLSQIDGHNRTPSSSSSTASALRIGLSAKNESSPVSTRDRPLTESPSQNQEGGKSRWIHCTPLFGSDEKVGVWMIVMVESENITGGINVPTPTVGAESCGGAGGLPTRYAAAGNDGGKLYHEYLRREGHEAQQSDPVRAHSRALGQTQNLTSPGQPHQIYPQSQLQKPPSIHSQQSQKATVQLAHHVSLVSGGGQQSLGGKQLYHSHSSAQEVRAGQYTGNGQHRSQIAGTLGSIAAREARTRADGEEGFVEF